MSSTEYTVRFIFWDRLANRFGNEIIRMIHRGAAVFAEMCRTINVLRGNNALWVNDLEADVQNGKTVH